MNPTVISPSNASFTCTAVGLPRPTITWINSSSSLPLSSDTYTTDGSGRQSTSTLTITNTEPQDAAQYECVASNVVSTVSHSATLTVHGKYYHKSINFRGIKFLLRCKFFGTITSVSFSTKCIRQFAKSYSAEVCSSKSYSVVSDA